MCRIVHRREYVTYVSINLFYENQGQFRTRVATDGYQPVMTPYTPRCARGLKSSSCCILRYRACAAALSAAGRATFSST